MDLANFRPEDGGDTRFGRDELSVRIAILLSGSPHMLIKFETECLASRTPDRTPTASYAGLHDYDAQDLNEA